MTAIKNNLADSIKWDMQNTDAIFQGGSPAGRLSSPTGVASPLSPQNNAKYA